MYKWKLYTLTKFVLKYDYLYKLTQNAAIIHTDYKSLTYFMESSIYKKIYRY